MVDAGAALERLRSDPRALPRLATLIENEDPRGLALLEAIYPHSGEGHVVGVTGPPGVGKSALIGALLEAVRKTERRVAVIAVDPSSPFTGGALLGDRIRMMQHHADPDVFVRSMASRGRTGGLAWATAEFIHLLDAAGFPVILVETVGTGQDGTDIAALADTVVVVGAPGLGDSVQALKSGLLEAADIYVVNKADLPGASEAVRSLRSTIALAVPADDRRRPVVATSATTGDGISELLATIDNHHAWLAQTGRASDRRERSARAEILAALRVTVDRRIDALSREPGQLAEIVARVAQRETTARRAADAIVAALDESLVPVTRGAIGDECGGRSGADAIVDVHSDEPRRA